MLILITLVVFIIFLIASILLLSIIYKDKIGVINRLEKFKNNKNKVEVDDLSIPFYERVIKPISESFSEFITKITPSGMKKRTEEKLIRAGKPLNIDSNKWFMLRITIGFMIPLAIIILLFINNNINLNSIFLIITIALFFNILPNLFLVQATNSRKRNIIITLPDILDLMTVSIEAGLSFDGALSRLVDKMEGVLSDEFNRVLNEMRMGKSRREALKDMSNRCDVPDLTTLIGALIQADELGVSISNVIRIQSIQMREKRRQRAQEKAMKAPVKMLFPLILFIFPSIFAVLLGPAVIRMIEVFSK